MMRLLVDSHLLIWAALGSQKLSKRAVKLLEDDENELWFSVASVWELSIKSTKTHRRPALGDIARLRKGLLRNGYLELSITSEHALAVRGLDIHHGDPFDRILVAQADVEGMQLLTADRELAAYPNTLVLR